MPANWTGNASFRRANRFERKADTRRTGEMIAKEKAVRGDGFLNHLAEPVKESLVCGFAEIIRRQDNDAIVAEIEGGARQVNRFGETGSPRPGEQAEVGILLADL